MEITQYKRLEDIPLPDYCIDYKIENLVRAIRGFGLTTHASCEGHLDKNRHQHPWVGFIKSYPEVEELKKIVRKYNRSHPIKWKVDSNWLLPSTYLELCHDCAMFDNLIKKAYKRHSKKKLIELQNSAEDFARFLYSHK